jgi:hypothetical protein
MVLFHISEQRIEQAKKIQRIQEYKKNSTLIPIQRLPIPSKAVTSSQREQQPLVDWETDERCILCIVQSVYVLRYIIFVRLEIFTAVKIQVVVVWVITPCSAVVGYQHFRGSCCLHL